jgi:hypothetical protein
LPVKIDSVQASLASKLAMAATTTSPIWLTRPEAAIYCGLSARTLENMAVLGKGPGFRKPARVALYRVSDLVAWIEGTGSRATPGRRQA